MNCNIFNKIKLSTTIIVVTILLMATRSFAQTTNEQVTTSLSVHKSRVPIWLNMGVGGGVAQCFDKGTIPFRYKIFGINAKGGVAIMWENYLVKVEGHGYSTSLTSFSGTAIGLNLYTELLYHCSKIHHWSFWIGGALQGFVDIKEIPALMNASTSISLFSHIGPSGMVQYDFAFNKAKKHNWLSTYLKVYLPLFGIANRPGFSYIGSPTLNDDELGYLKEQETFGKFFPGLGTDLGLYLNLPNGNRIGLNYGWDYLSTGKKGTYRYDNALHSVSVSFMFRLN